MPNKRKKDMGEKRVREIWTSTPMNEWFEQEWAGMAQVFRLRRYVKEAQKEREEIVHGFTNLRRKQAWALRLLQLPQAHWRIENRLHRRRDVTDSGKMRLRCVSRQLPKHWQHSMEAYSRLLDWLPVRNVASAMRHFCAHPQQALRLLCGALSR